MKSRKLLWLGLLVAATVIALIVQPVTVFAQEILDQEIIDNFMWQRTQNIFFMYMLVAFLMLFVKRMEWIVCLATMATLCVSLPVYAFLKTVVFTNAFSVMPTGWTVDFLAMGIVMSITLVIAIGIPLGTVKHGAYVIMGITFPFAFLAMEWFMFEYLVGVLDAGGSIVVHAAAWAFGFGMIMGIRHKGALTAPMDITTHSVSFVWLASMLLFILWPSFVTVLLTPGQVVDVAIVTYMSGFGAAVAAYAVNWVIDKKVDPLIYTYAMLCGMVAIGSTCDLVGPWAGLIIGVVAGAGSVLSFKYWQPISERIFGVKDMMGVQNLHGFGGILGALICAVMFAGLVQVWALLGAIVIMIVVGVITGLLCRSRPEVIVNDSEAFALEPERQEPY
jgi:ammonium transporter Rh